MRIAWYTHRYHPCIGGAEAYGRAIVQRFLAEGHQVDVLTSNARDLWYFNDPRRERLDAPAVENVDGATVHRFPVRHVPLQRYAGKLLAHVPIWSLQCRFESYMPLIPALERHQGWYDLVCAVGFPFTLFSFAAWKTARRNNAPLVLTPFLHLSTPGDPVHRHYSRPHQKRLLREADVVVVMTNLERLAVESWDIPSDHILINPMGYDQVHVTSGDRATMRARLDIPQNSFVIGHLATLDPNKGTNDLVQSVAQLNQGRDPENLIRLVLAGVSSPHFEAFANTLPESTSQWLIRTGPLPDALKADFFAMLDLFAMPSRTDSFGIVFLEAWANGLPVVAARAGGVPEVIDHEQNGLLVPFGDVSALANSLNRLERDASLRHQFGQAGARKVASGYSWDDCYRRLMQRVAPCLDPGRRLANDGPRPRPTRHTTSTV